MKEGSIGGGNIKLMGACGFVLGVKRGYIALMLGLFLAVLFQTAYAKKRGQRICNGAVSGVGMPACHAACIKNYDKNGGKKK